jgi:hypothetical protein
MPDNERAEAQQPFVGEQWTDVTVRAWAAGYFDRAGSIIVRPDIGRISLTVVGRDPVALEALRSVFGFGEIGPHPRIAALHVWLVRAPDDIFCALSLVGPFLVSKSTVASEALPRIREFVQERARRVERDRRILALRETGAYTQAEIAEMTGATVYTVSNVIARWRRDNQITIRAGQRSRAPF